MRRYLIIASPYLKELPYEMPLVSYIQNLDPKNRVEVLAEKPVADFFRGEKRISRVYVRDPEENQLKQLRAFRKHFRKTAYYCVILMNKRSWAGLLTSLLPARNKVAFHTQPLSPFFHRVNYRKIMAVMGALHRVQRNLLLCKDQILPPKRPDYHFKNPPSSGIRKLTANKPYFVIAPAPEKLRRYWASVNWENLMERLPPKAQTYIIGNKKDHKVCRNLKAFHPLSTDLSGRLSWQEMLYLMKSASRVFTNTNDFMHLSNLVDAALTVIPDGTRVEPKYKPLVGDLKILTPATFGDELPASTLFTAREMKKVMTQYYSEEELIATAIDTLRTGGVILHQTDTIPGLATNAINKDAVARLYQLKGRDPEKPMIILCSGIRMIKQYVRELPDVVFHLMDRSEGHPLTIIFPGAKNLPDSLCGPDGSVGIRIPQSSFLQDFIDRLGFPIASTSANLSGEKPPGNMDSLSTGIQEKVDLILPVQPDLTRKKASTIIKIERSGNIQLLRQGDSPAELTGFIQESGKTTP